MPRRMPLQKVKHRRKRQAKTRRLPITDHGKRTRRDH